MPLQTFLNITYKTLLIKSINLVRMNRIFYLCAVKLLNTRLMNVLYRIVRRNAKNANGEVYARVVTNSLITTDDLVDLIAKDSQVERAQVALVTDAIGKQIKELVMNGHNIKVGSLGTLGIGFRTKWSDTPMKVNINDCLKTVRVKFYSSEEIKNLQRSCRKIRTTIRNKTEN